MELIFDVKNARGEFKRLNAVNGGPLHKRHSTSQYRSNFSEYEKAKIPFTRNHDSGADAIHGGPYSHDVAKIFPRFDADPTDPASYDFACTDEDILVALDAGTKTFFRLGETIEHQVKKHNTLPPADFHKWAVICEHIIRHYTEGWADGFYHDMPYWEIWNEPNLDPEDAAPCDKKCWGGTTAQFYDLYEIAAKHLKSCFPHLKIGGPSIAFNERWTDEFLAEMKRRNVPIDFLSWHQYAHKPHQLFDRAEKVDALLKKHGYEDAENFLTEWNYILGWRDKFVYSIETMGNAKGAAFVMACISMGQESPVDMMMYYDLRAGVFNGAFDLYTFRPRKAYYPLMWYGMFYDMAHPVSCLNKEEDVYTLSGVDAQGKTLTAVTYYTDDVSRTDLKEITLNFSKSGKYELYLLDDTHNAELFSTVTEPKFTLQPNSCMLVREI